MSKNSQRTSIPCFKTWLSTIRPKSDILPQVVANKAPEVKPMYKTFKRR
jgi:hypothetical protein